MLKKLIFYFFLFVPVFSIAQKKDKQAKKAAATITIDDLKSRLAIIASPEMEGRNTPSAGLEKAADYISSQFKSFGLLPGNNGSYRQAYPLYQDEVISSAMQVNEEAMVEQQDFTPFSRNYAADMYFSQAVFAGYGIVDEGKRNDYKGLDVTGKLVVILNGTPDDYTTASRSFRSPSSVYGKMQAAAKEGAAALFIVFPKLSKGFSGFSDSWTRQIYKSSQTIFSFFISEDAAAKIIGTDGNSVLTQLKTGSLTSKTCEADIHLAYNKKTKTSSASNIIGVLEGSDLKDEYVFITAHYDHLGKRGEAIYYGADDDGSGTTAVLEMAEAFAKAKADGHGPRRSIVFMTVSGEEKGLWGSAYYTDHPIFPLDKTTVDLNIDMIGRTDSSRHYGDSLNYVYVVGDDKLSTDLKPISEKINQLYTKLELDYKFNDPNDKNRIYFRSDHYNFADKGVPIIFYYDGMLGADYHKPTDTPDKINYALYQKRAQLVFYTAWEMANRDDMLKRDLKLSVPSR
ncbi:MAG: M28 family peptidase [Chitinophagaceae bacterium]